MLELKRRSAGDWKQDFLICLFLKRSLQVTANNEFHSVPWTASPGDKQTIPLIAHDCYKSSAPEGMTEQSQLHCWSPRPVALTGHVVHRWRASDGTAAPHWEITQRWDLMALRLSGSEKPTSDPQHWPLLTPPILQGPVLVIGHLSNPSHWSDYRPIWDLPTTHFWDQDKLLSATLHDNKWPDCCRKSKGTSICSTQTREMA